MDIPIFDGSTVIGRLAIRREGLYTVLEAFLPAQKGLRRLWVAGGGKSADLGLCEPREDGLHFRRAYSRAALAALPSPLERAALDAVPAEPEPPSPAPPPVPAAPAAAPEHSPAPPHRRADWLPLPDGSLFSPARGLLALPCALRNKRPGVRILRIGGREYLIFHT